MYAYMGKTTQQRNSTSLMEKSNNTIAVPFEAIDRVRKLMALALAITVLLILAIAILPTTAHGATVEKISIGSTVSKVKCQSGSGVQQYHFTLTQSSNLMITIKHPTTKTDENFLSVRLTDGANYLTQIDTKNIKGNGNVNGYLAVPSAFGSSKIMYKDIPAGGPYFIEITTNSRIRTSISDQYFTNIGFKKNSFYTLSTTSKFSVAEATIKVGKAKTYTGKAIKAKPTVTLYDKELVLNKDYKLVNYKNNVKMGKAQVTVKGIGNYSGSKKISFTIAPSKVLISKPVAGDNKINIKWKTKSGISGYEVRYRDGYQTFDFTQFKNVTRWNTWSKSVTVSKTATSKSIVAKDKTKYQVQVRAYKTIDGKRYYGAWSSIKTLTTK